MTAPHHLRSNLPRKLDISLADPKMLLTFVSVALFFLFQTLVIFSAINLDGRCMFTFWLPTKNQLVTPYWLFSFIVALLNAFATANLLLCLTNWRRRLSGVIYYLIASLVLGVWSYGMFGFWRAMEYERGEISAEQFYGHHLLSRLVPVYTPHECQGNDL